MADPLLTLAMLARRRTPLGKVSVKVPQEVPSTDAVFLVLRRMRAPLIYLISVFAIAVLGLTMIPGVDENGRTWRMTAFDAFYFMTYTVTTVGYTESPDDFSIAQRMWVTIVIYASVVGWAYAVASAVGLAQETAFRSALSAQRLRRRVERLHEPFVLIAGYGHAGRLIGLTLDSLGHRFVVLDGREERVQMVQADALHADVPCLAADARKPGVLGLAGLGHKKCEAVLALTDNDEVNLQIVMAVHLLRPELPVIARSDTRTVADRMRDFNASAVINPYDRYGEYLVMALHKPNGFQLAVWLTQPPGTAVPPVREGLRNGRWLVSADDEFGREIAQDLSRAGLDVQEVDPEDPDPSLENVVGFVAGSSSDSTNLAMAAHLRREAPQVFLSVRQESHDTGPLITAFDFDSVFIPTEIVARECLARVATPMYWSVIRHAIRQSDEWALTTLQRLVDTCGPELARSVLFTLDRIQAPAPTRWLMKGGELTLADLLCDPDDRNVRLAAVPLLVVHHSTDDQPERKVYFPGDDHPLAAGDQILMMATPEAHHAMDATLFYDDTLHYVHTGETVASTWAWRALQRRRTPA